VISALSASLVMGQNLVLNMNDHGFKVAVSTAPFSKVDDFIANEAKGRKRSRSPLHRRVGQPA